MLFEVYSTRRDGQPLMRHQWSSTLRRGHLEVKEMQHPDLNRMTRVARLLDDNGKPLDGQHELLDAVLLAAHLGWWSMAGYERVQLMNGPVDYAQSWVLCPIKEVV